ncbi:MAG: SURF1 family protein [Rhizobiaceae bacterium]|nr:SURF1 family protein [Rhizobiaceae bacterium]
MRKSTALIIFAMISGIGFLSALGTWQVVRMNWKEELIARTQARASSDPVSLAQIEEIWKQTADIGYMKVQLQGTFDHAEEMYYFNTLNGVTGWNIITPLSLQDGRVVLLNRGFVPAKLKEKSKRLDGQIEGLVKIVGLARNPVTKKPNSFMPDNELDKRDFFWKSYSQMASLVSDKSPAQILPFLIDAGKSELEGGFPLGGTTRMKFPNSHLQYAITWYGLALSLLAVGSAFLYGRRKEAA